MSGFSIWLAWSTFDSDSFLLEIVIWNFYAAASLARLGWLPVCNDCELVTLFEVMFWAFLVGWIGYSIFMFFLLLLVNRRALKSPQAPL